MMQRLSASLGTDAEVLKCFLMLACAVAMMWPQRHNGLLYWSMRGAFTLAVALCFPRCRAAAAAAAARGMATLRLVCGNAEGINGRAAGRAQAPAPVAASVGTAAPTTSRVERHRQIDSWRWEDTGDAICVTAQLPPLGLDHNDEGNIIAPTATARIMPQDFTLTISTSKADHVLEVKKLFNAVDPRTSGTSVDESSGLVTLRLAKWFDSSTWKTLVDEGKHPLASMDMDLDADTSKSNFAGVVGKDE
jgi:hypothetical protein